MSKFNPSRLLAWQFQNIEHTYSERDSLFYALSIGIGSNPLDAGHLQFTYEKDLRTFPTQAVVLGMSDMGFLTDPEVGIDLSQMLHVGLTHTFHLALPPAGTVLSKMKIAELVDKGAGRGSLLRWERTLVDMSTGELAVTEVGTFLLRGNGGLPTSFRTPSAQPPMRSIPERPSDLTSTVSTTRQAALLYRLNGDYNPLHADPNLAMSVGFPRPILHGCYTYGAVAHELVQRCCKCDSVRLKSLDLRFTAAVFPGETLSVDIWNENSCEASFRARVPERRGVVVAEGFAEIRPLESTQQ